MLSYDGVEILKTRKRNPLNAWHALGGTKTESSDPRHASNRAWNRYAKVGVNYDGSRLKLDDPVFAMGSCFAREIEKSLKEKGGRVVSIDDRVYRTEFGSAKGSFLGFFNRFTPWAMWQEFKRCFDELPGWSDEALLVPGQGEEVVDLHYWILEGSPSTLEDALTRRRIARDLVREVVGAKVVILTLGLIEAWYHKPSGLYVNHPKPNLLARKPWDFELRLMQTDDVIACLEEIHDLIKRHHVDGDFEFVVTVSPVPMGATFTDKDVIVANAESKAVLRAAAGAFAERRPRVRYFPSYEMVTLSALGLAWMPDRLHVKKGMVDWVIDTFMQAYYEPAAILAPLAKPPR